jgi:hypothetical protein
VACLADQINNRPVFISLLKMIESQSYGFVPSQPTRVRAGLPVIRPELGVSQ